jgi:competence protein ComEC
MLSLRGLIKERRKHMPTIHFLNVKQGDCIGIAHYSGHKTIIDVCNAQPVAHAEEARVAKFALLERAVSGNFNQKKYPVNPVSYFQNRGWSDVFRFILTHPDMDHMDGIKTFFDEFTPTNFWDTDNTKEMDEDSWKESPYNEEDWTFYKNLRDKNPQTNPKRLTLLSGTRGQYYNMNEDGSGGGDGLHILAPTQDLVDAANEAAEDYNRCSYVILYRTGEHRILFGGDSHDESWNHILSEHKDDVTNVDILIAPHHGRKPASRSYEYLDVLKPKLTFFGNAPSEHLAYGAWNSRNLPFITNNQAGNIIVDASVDPIKVYVTHKPFAEAVNPNTYYSELFKAYFLVEFT